MFGLRGVLPDVKTNILYLRGRYTISYDSYTAVVGTEAINQ